MRHRLRRAVMVAADPGDPDPAGELPEQGEDLPVTLVQAPEVDGIEDITVEDQLPGGNLGGFDFLEERDEEIFLADGAAKVEVGNDDAVVDRVKAAGGLGTASRGSVVVRQSNTFLQLGKNPRPARGAAGELLPPS